MKQIRKQSLRYLLPTLFFLLVVNTLFSQGIDTTRIVGNGEKKAIGVTNIQDLTRDGFNFWQDKFSGHFAGLDVGFNMFLNKDYVGYDPAEHGFMNNDLFRSNSLYVNLISQSIGLQYNRNTIGLVTGLGLQLQSYRLDQNTTITTDMYGKVIPKTLYFESNQKSKLSLSYLFVPLLAEFQIPLKHYANRLYLSAGFYGGVRIGAHTKIKYRVDSQKEKLKTPDDFSINRYKYGLMFRGGYRWLNIFATYDLSTLFEEDMGPKLTPFTFGITLLKL